MLLNTIINIKKDNCMSTCELKKIGAGVSFERIRRITGYLTTEKRWNNAKKAELEDRVKHS